MPALPVLQAPMFHICVTLEASFYYFDDLQGSMSARHDDGIPAVLE